MSEATVTARRVRDAAPQKLKKLKLPWRDRAGRFSPFKAAVLLGVLLPGALLAWQWAVGTLGARPVTEVIHGTGLWTVRFLLITLAISPLRRLADQPRVMLVRRMLGVGAMGYAVAHLLLYAVDQNFHLLTVATEIVKRFYLTIGFVALLGLVLLGLISTDGWTRRLGRRWKRLQRLVYPIIVLGLLHYFLQSKSDVSEAVFAAGLFVALMLWRLLPTRFGNSAVALALLAPVITVLTALVEYAWYAVTTNIPASRVLWANLDVSFGLRPALWDGVVVLAAALLAALAKLLNWAVARRRMRAA